MSAHPVVRVTAHDRQRQPMAGATFQPESIAEALFLCEKSRVVGAWYWQITLGEVEDHAFIPYSDVAPIVILPVSEESVA